jgi:hypothetical protein
MSSPTAESEVVLTVTAPNHLKLTLSDLSRFLRRSVRATDELGKEFLFEGVSLTEILLAGGVKFGKSFAENVWRIIYWWKPKTGIA